MSKAFAYLSGGLLATLAVSTGTVSAQGYETPPTFLAAKVLAPQVFLNHYQE